MAELHLWKEEPVRAHGNLTLGATIECEGKPRRNLWYRIPERFSEGQSDTLNPFVVGTLFTAMRESRDLVAHGVVSKTLLVNLEEFVAAWSAWLPEAYSRIEIKADSEKDDPGCEKTDDAIAAFSGEWMAHSPSIGIMPDSAEGQTSA